MNIIQSPKKNDFQKCLFGKITSAAKIINPLNRMAMNPEVYQPGPGFYNPKRPKGWEVTI